jgi:hypothetical protein
MRQIKDIALPLACGMACAVPFYFGLASLYCTGEDEPTLYENSLYETAFWFMAFALAVFFSLLLLRVPRVPRQPEP